MEKYQVKIDKDFNLDHIFDCGQCFRFEKQEDGSYTGVAFKKVVNLAYEKDSGILTIDNCSKEDFQKLWYGYLDLDTDYGLIKESLGQWDEVIKSATSYGEGIRILRQEPWETLISFIVSQNNNIPRIKGCIEKMCQAFGEPIGEYQGKLYYSFPEPERLAKLSLQDLEPIKLGYRAGYILDTARHIASQGGVKVLEEIADSKVSSQEAFERILEYQGVGPKVASCIMLFGLNKFDSFPIDVWMKRIMNYLYGIDERNFKEMNNYASTHFKHYGGYAQQYLFYYARGLEELQKKNSQN